MPKKTKNNKNNAGLYCDNPFCESPAVVEVPVSVNKAGDETRHFCAACEEAYMIGRQHMRFVVSQAAETAGD